MEHGEQDISTLSVAQLLSLYRKQLQPGAYFFVGKAEHSQLTDIVEVRSSARGLPGERGGRVSFAFYEKGRPPLYLERQGIGSWLDKFPFTHHVGSTSVAFQHKLALYIREQLGYAASCPDKKS